MMFISQKAEAALLDNKQSMRDNPRGKVVLRGCHWNQHGNFFRESVFILLKVRFFTIALLRFFFQVISSYTPTKCYVAREHIRRNVPHAIGKAQWKWPWECIAFVAPVSLAMISFTFMAHTGNRKMLLNAPTTNAVPFYEMGKKLLLVQCQILYGFFSSKMLCFLNIDR